MPFTTISLYLVVIPLAKNINTGLFNRITVLCLLLSGYLSLNTVSVLQLGQGITITSGFLQISTFTSYFEPFLFLMAIVLLLPGVGYQSVPSEGYSSDSTLHFATPSELKGVISGVNNQKNKLAESLFKKEMFPNTPEHSLIILFGVMGGTLLICSSDIITMYLSLELQSFAVYVLASLYRDNERATAAGLKYFLLGAFSSALILLGAALLYSQTGITNYENVIVYYSLGQTSTTLEQGVQMGVLLGFFLMGVGFLFKVSSAPFHQWAPDVYDGVPTIITLWLTVMPKISIMIVLYYLGTLANLLDITNLILHIPVWLPTHFIVNPWQELLLICSVFSLVVGTVLGLSQTKVKRLMSYSTISHVGFMLIALSLSTYESTKSLFFYLTQYSVTTANFFLILLAIGYLLKTQVESSSIHLLESSDSHKRSLDLEFIQDLKGVFYNTPLLGLSIIVCLFSIAGIPPLIGFFAKYYVLYASMQSGYYLLCFIAILTSVVSTTYYLKLIANIHFDEEKPSTEPQILNIQTNDKPVLVITQLHAYVISVLTLGIILFIFQPSLLLNTIELVSVQLFYD